MGYIWDMITLTENSAFTIHPYAICKHPTEPLFVRSDGLVMQCSDRPRVNHAWTPGSWSKSGYYHVHVHREGHPKTLYAHRLVAECFLDNVENKRTVDHINGRRSDNRVENLRYCTHKEQAVNRHSYQELEGEPWLQFQREIYDKHNKRRHNRKHA